MANAAEEKLRKLVALALGTNHIDEARTAALAALKLAAKEGLFIIPPEENAPRTKKPRAPPKPKSPPKNGTTSGEPQSWRTVRPSPEPREPAWKRQGNNYNYNWNSWRDRPQGEAFVNSFAQSKGECSHCGGSWIEGEVIAKRGNETCHAGCAAQRR